MDRPMLAASYRDGDPLKFPLLATFKVDGIRALVVGGKLVSRSFRPIPNDHIRHALENLLPEGADGEIHIKSFYDTTSTVMSQSAEVKSFTFYWFDWAYDLDAPYEQRAMAMVNKRIDKKIEYPYVIIHKLMPKRITSLVELQKYESYAINRGFEGLVVRRPDGKYKCGRSTLKEGLMIKIKRNDDCEAPIVGTVELVHNNNEAIEDNFGRVKRGSSKNNLVPGGTLGALVARCEDGEFKIGTGFSNDQRAALWANRDAIVTHLVKYTCSGHGNRGLPRSPVFKGIRHQDDI